MHRQGHRFARAHRAQAAVLYAAAGALSGRVSLALDQSLNFRVFTQAAHDILRADDLYVRRTIDYFKYSPTFALLFVPFGWLPPVVAAPLWGALNFFVAFWGIDRVVKDDVDKRLALVLAFVGICLATDGDQSNLLVGGAFLLAFAAFENARPAVGSVWLTMASFVKIFPMVGGVFALLHPRPAKSLLWLACFTLLWAVAPRVVCTPRELVMEYRSWGNLLSWDHANHGWSLMSMIGDTLHTTWSTSWMQFAGGAVQASSILAAVVFGSDAPLRRTIACSLLAFVVLFNHRAEYATYVLSAMALSVWYATGRRSRAKLGLLLASFVAPGPWYTVPDGRISGALAFLAAHREFHPLRVAPLSCAWVLMQRELWLPHVHRFRLARVKA